MSEEKRVLRHFYSRVSAKAHTLLPSIGCRSAKTRRNGEGEKMLFFFALCRETQKKLKTMCIICEILAEESRTRVLALPSPSKSMLESWNPSKAAEWMPKRERVSGHRLLGDLFSVFFGYYHADGIQYVLRLHSNFKYFFFHLLHTTAQRDEKKEEKKSMIIECWARSLRVQLRAELERLWADTRECGVANSSSSEKNTKPSEAAAWKESKKNFDRIYSHDTPEESVTVPEFQRAHRKKKTENTLNTQHSSNLSAPSSFFCSFAGCCRSCYTSTPQQHSSLHSTFFLVQPPKSSGRTTAPLIGDNRCVVLSSLCVFAHTTTSSSNIIVVIIRPRLYVRLCAAGCLDVCLSFMNEISKVSGGRRTGWLKECGNDLCMYSLLFSLLIVSCFFLLLPHIS